MAGNVQGSAGRPQAPLGRGWALSICASVHPELEQQAGLGVGALGSALCFSEPFFLGAPMRTGPSGPSLTRRGPHSSSRSADALHRCRAQGVF